LASLAASDGYAVTASNPRLRMATPSHCEQPSASDGCAASLRATGGFGWLRRVMRATGEGCHLAGPRAVPSTAPSLAGSASLPMSECAVSAYESLVRPFCGAFPVDGVGPGLAFASA